LRFKSFLKFKIVRCVTLRGEVSLRNTEYVPRPLILTAPTCRDEKKKLTSQVWNFYSRTRARGKRRRATSWDEVGFLRSVEGCRCGRCGELQDFGARRDVEHDTAPVALEAGKDGTQIVLRSCALELHRQATERAVGMWGIGIHAPRLGLHG
jgi:hypothetical protein